MVSWQGRRFSAVALSHRALRGHAAARVARPRLARALSRLAGPAAGASLFCLPWQAHHPAAQQILLRTCKECGVRYTAGSALSIYREMIASFRSPRSLCKEIMVYGRL